MEYDEDMIKMLERLDTIGFLRTIRADLVSIKDGVPIGTLTIKRLDQLIQTTDHFLEAKRRLHIASQRTK